MRGGGRGQGCRVGLCVLRPIERELSLLVAAVAALGALGAAVQSAEGPTQPRRSRHLCHTRRRLGRAL